MDEETKMKIVELGPLQPKAPSPGRPQKYPFDAMMIGGSLFFPSTHEEPRPWRTRTSLTAWANKRYGSEGHRFMTRKHVMEDGTLGARITRVK